MLLETAHPPHPTPPSNKEDMTKGILSASNRLTQGPFRACETSKGSPREKVVESLWNSN